MTTEQRRKLFELLPKACGHSHSTLDQFLAFEFDDTGFRVNPNLPIGQVVYELIRTVERQNALEPKFALALQTHFSTNADLALVARDVLLVEPLGKLREAFDRAADPDAVTKIAAEKYVELRPRYATDHGPAPATPAEFAERLAGFESKTAVVKFALLFQFVWQVWQAAAGPLGPAAAALERWLNETAERVTATRADRDSLLAAARQAGGSGRAPLRHVVILVAPAAASEEYHVHAWVMAEDGGGAVRLTDRDRPATGPDAVVAEDKVKRPGAVALDAIRASARQYLPPDDPDVWYEFFLPPGLIDLAVADAWLLDKLGFRRDSRLGTRHIVTIRSTLPYERDGFEAFDELRARWEQFRACAEGGACPIADPAAADFLKALERDEVLCCVFSRPYRPNFDAEGDALYAALSAGVPVALWWRSDPPPGVAVAALPLTDLPHRVRKSRSAGALNLTLFWDDPRRRPPDGVR